MNEGGPSGDELIPAATVILGRDGSEGLEVLMLRRNSKIAFGGAWVFPGGRVDPEDAGSTELERAQSAAVRESMEETGLDITGQKLGVWSYWVPPPLKSMVVEGKLRRFSTWFFVGAAPDTDVAIDMGEIHEHRWLRPTTAMDLQRSGEIELVPPTFVTLHQLAQSSSIEAAIASTDGVAPSEFLTRPIRRKPITLTWDGDVAYDDPALIDEPGPRNRLVMAEGNWAYESQ